MLLRAPLTALTLLSLVPLNAAQDAQEEAEEQEVVLLRAADVELRPAPWVVGDFFEYEVRSPKGDVIGMFYTWTEPVEGDASSERLWMRRFHGVGDQVVGSVRVSRDALRPADSQVLPGPGKLLFSTYGPGEVVVDVAGTSNAQTLDQDVYDSQTLIYLIRRLPLAVGTKIRLPVFDAIAGLSSVRFDVEEEHVRMKDRIDCFKVTASTGLTVWVTKDDRRLPVWVQQGKDFRCVLTAERKLGDALGNFDAGPLAFDLGAPDGWVLGQPQPAKDGHLTATAVCLREPASVFIEISTLDDADTRDVANFANRARGRAKKRYRGYNPRHDSWEESTVGGHPAITFTADYREEGERGWVQRRTLIRAERLVAEFVYRAPDSEFERQAGALTALANSFHERPLTPAPSGD